LCFVMREPVALLILPAQILALPRGVGEPVVVHNVGLGEVAGAGGEVPAVVGRLEGGG